jgi:hypothetical protein
VSHAFRFASWDNGIARPIHLLWALSEVPGRVGLALSLPDGRTLAEVVDIAAPGRPSSAVTSYHLDEIQDAAHLFAASRGEHLSPGHLLLAVLDHVRQRHSVSWMTWDSM